MVNQTGPLPYVGSPYEEGGRGRDDRRCKVESSKGWRVGLARRDHSLPEAVGKALRGRSLGMGKERQMRRGVEWFAGGAGHNGKEVHLCRELGAPCAGPGCRSEWGSTGECSGQGVLTVCLHPEFMGLGLLPILVAATLYPRLQSGCRQVLEGRRTWCLGHRQSLEAVCLGAGCELWSRRPELFCCFGAGLLCIIGFGLGHQGTEGPCTLHLAPRPGHLRS